MVEKPLKNSAAKGILWNTLDNLSMVVVQLLVNILLARVLLPSDFGMIGMLGVFIAISQTFVDSGMSQALIRKNDRTEVDFETAFLYNFSISVLAYAILFVTAPLIGEFYNLREIVDVVRVLGLSVIVNSLIIVPQSKLIINMEFKKLAKLNFVSFFTSGAVALVMAISGFGVWAIVCQTLLRATLSACLLSYFGAWKPSLNFSRESFHYLFGFGSKLLGSGILATAFQNIYKVIIGKTYAAKYLGYYSQGFQLVDIISGTVTSALQRVTFPILASIQDDRTRMVSVYRRMIGMTAFVIFPVMTLLSLLAEPLIKVILSDKWLPIIPLLQWLAFARIVYPISAVNMNILNAIGRSDLFLKVDLVKIPLTLVTLVVTIPFGLEVIVMGQVGTSFVAFFINAYLPGRLFGYGPWEQTRDLFTKILSTGLMAGAVLFINSLVADNTLKLFLGSIIGVISYLCFSTLFKVGEIKDAFLVSRNVLQAMNIAKFLRF